MKECQECEYRGYSPEVCMLHARHCAKREGGPPKKVSRARKLGARTLAGAGLAVAAVAVGSAALSLVGGALLVKIALVKVAAGAGMAGGGFGLATGLRREKKTAKVER